MNLDSATRLAAQTNRMVLIHFWADWCEACKEAEQEVLSRPDVAAALEAGFVPVRVNVDYFPHTREQYGVTVLPSDIVITPQGQLVDRIVGTTSASQYLARLNQAAAIASNRASGGYGQAAFRSSAGAQEAAASRPDGPAYGGVDPTRPGPPAYADGRYADSLNGHNGQQGQVLPTGPRYGGVVVDNQGGPAPQAERPRVSIPVYTAQLPPGNPPLALDGYCPVRLAENERWVLGDHRWGLIHRGRTYLFAGPEERDRFNANPDHYAPVLSGNDVVVAIERGEMVPGRREYGGWFEDRVYLFSSEATFQKFNADPNRYISGLRQSGSSTARRPADRPAMLDMAAPGSVPRDPYGRWQ